MTTNNPENGTILIVDDNLTNLGVLFEHLRTLGYKVLVAEGGKSAIKRALLAQPDIILLDVLMPEMDGFETCRRLKANDKTRDIPVILMTALSDIENKVKGFTAGAVDYVTKPAQYEEVAARIHTHLTIRNLQKDLQLRLLEREQLVQELDAYAQMVAHDLKAPLALTLGFADILQTNYDRISREKVDEILNTILRNGWKMQGIIDDLLLLANIRQQQIKFSALDMYPIFIEARSRLSAQIEDSQVEISVPDKFHAVKGYLPWIEQVWFNLLNNAIKYGGASPKIIVTSELTHDGFACFSIQDNGVGLTKVQQEKLFTPFTRFSSNAAIDGHGLGLSIVKRIVTRLGGTVGVDSEPGYGSTFYFCLPAADPEQVENVGTAVHQS